MVTATLVCVCLSVCLQARRERIARRIAAAESGEVLADSEADKDYIDPTPVKSNAKIAEVVEVC